MAYYQTATMQTSSYVQRGSAAHMRQRDDNSRRKILTPAQRKFLNKVIHDPSMVHRPEFDERLGQLTAKFAPDQVSDEGVTAPRHDSELQVALTSEVAVVDHRELESEIKLLKAQNQVLRTLLSESCQLVRSQEQDLFLLRALKFLLPVIALIWLMQNIDIVIAVVQAIATLTLAVFVVMILRVIIVANPALWR